MCANESDTISSVSSRKRWQGLYPEEWVGDLHMAAPLLQPQGISAAEQGTTCFSDPEHLPDCEGTYELRCVSAVNSIDHRRVIILRYHHDGKHNVMARSEPFRVEGVLRFRCTIKIYVAVL